MLFSIAEVGLKHQVEFDSACGAKKALTQLIYLQLLTVDPDEPDLLSAE